MPSLRVLSKFKDNIQESQTTAGRVSKPDITLVSGTAAPSLDQALNSTAPLFFGPRLTVCIGATKAPLTPVSRKYAHRQRTSRKNVARRPTDVEMIAFSPATPSRKESEESFAFELLSTSVVPVEFPAGPRRSESVYARRNE